MQSSSAASDRASWLRSKSANMHVARVGADATRASSRWCLSSSDHAHREILGGITPSQNFAMERPLWGMVAAPEAPASGRGVWRSYERRSGELSRIIVGHEHVRESVGTASTLSSRWCLVHGDHTHHKIVEGITPSPKFCDGASPEGYGRRARDTCKREGRAWWLCKRRCACACSGVDDSHSVG